MATYWDQKFFESTRGQIVTLLRRGGRTVEELEPDRGLHLAQLLEAGNLNRSGYHLNGYWSDQHMLTFCAGPPAASPPDKALHPVPVDVAQVR